MFISVFCLLPTPFYPGAFHTEPAAAACTQEGRPSIAGRNLSEVLQRTASWLLALPTHHSVCGCVSVCVCAWVADLSAAWLKIFLFAKTLSRQRREDLWLHSDVFALDFTAFIFVLFFDIFILVTSPLTGYTLPDPELFLSLSEGKILNLVLCLLTSLPHWMLPH